MGPSVRADRHSGIDHLLSDLRMPARHLADLKKSRPQTLVGQGFQHGLGAAQPGAIVEGQNDLLVAKEIEPFGVLD